jgi:hypothetical protein
LEKSGISTAEEMATACRKLGGAPEDFYDKTIADEALRCSKMIREFVRLYEAWDSCGPEEAADIFGLTTSELQTMNIPMIWDMLEEGRPLLDDGTWQEALAEFQRLRSAGYIIRVEGGWKIRR